MAAILASQGMQVTLTIDKLVYGGAGLAKHDGQACFIDGALPGETVLARIIETRSGYARAQLIEVLEPSAARIEPACPVAGLCGGCQWQHCRYAEQLQYKTDIVRDCLSRIGKLQSVPVAHATASPRELRYRSRAAFKISEGRSPRIGFYQTKSHAVVQITDCLLLEPALVTGLQLCRALLKKDPRRFAGCTDVQLLALDNSPVVLGLWHDERYRKKIPLALNTATGEMLDHAQPLQETVLGLQFLRDTGNFYQVNRQQNLAMIQAVLEFMQPIAGADILDLFCGCGNFSLFLAQAGGRVTGIDSNSAAIREASSNAAQNSLANTKFMAANVHGLNAGMLAHGYDAVLVNPPRGGCGPEALTMIMKLNPAVLVYISCNPSTLARDLRLLADNGYSIDAVQPFDMFPQTYHIETVVQLSNRQREAL